MTIIQCKLCRKPFTSAGNKLCNDCVRQAEKDFFVVRDFIYDNKGSDVDTITKETGVSKEIILHLIREGRFYYEDINTTGTGVYSCKKCGNPAGSDKICRECKAKIATELQYASAKKSSNRPASSQSPQDRGIGFHSKRESDK